MTVTELDDEYRRRAFDRASKALFDTTAVLFALREAETEACRRGLIIRDATTAAVCQYAVAIGDPWITLDQRVIKVLRADLWTPNVDDAAIVQKRELQRELSADLPRGWINETGEPDAIVVDVATRKLRLNQIPTKAGSLHLIVVRLPLLPMTVAPEIPERYHLQLVPWVIWRAFGNQDTELHEPQLAGAAYAEFEASFGTAVSANDDLWIGNRGNRRRGRTRWF